MVVSTVKAELVKILEPEPEAVRKNTKKRIFISSVQKELELERAAVAGLISADPL